MTNGSVLLVDEISLADDSVLERMNSILEPERTLLLIEETSTSECRQIVALEPCAEKPNTNKRAQRLQSTQATAAAEPGGAASA